VSARTAEKEPITRNQAKNDRDYQNKKTKCRKVTKGRKSNCPSLGEIAEAQGKTKEKLNCGGMGGLTTGCEAAGLIASFSGKRGARYKSWEKTV